jgi:acyl-CoA synthetase (AMP-forming)/AMP-acid ligase II
VRLATADGGEPGPGEPGVLWIRHPALALGYANRPAQTAAQFREGWFCSQDYFARDREGFFSHQGRADELVKIAGQWVQPVELEEAIAGEPLIAEAACLPVADHDRFERLALFIVARGDPATAVAAASRACERKLPTHKRPKWVVPVAELPRTPTGKVQRFKLREQLEQDLKKT